MIQVTLFVLALLLAAALGGLLASLWWLHHVLEDQAQARGRQRRGDG